MYPLRFNLQLFFNVFSTCTNKHLLLSLKNSLCLLSNSFSSRLAFPFQSKVFSPTFSLLQQQQQKTSSSLYPNSGQPDVDPARWCVETVSPHHCPLPPAALRSSSLFSGFPVLAGSGFRSSWSLCGGYG